MLKKIVVLFQLQTSESFTVYVINVNVPRVRANADKCLQHHQGCPETPKSADVICERPLMNDSRFIDLRHQLHRAKEHF